MPDTELAYGDHTPLASRRDRQRAATVAEIKAAARQRLAQGGPSAIGLRAIARDLGLSAPALYRYFPSHEELLSALIVDLYDELTATMIAVRDTRPPEDLIGRLTLVALALRDWAVTHPAEFGLVFGSPVPDPLQAHEESPCHEAGMRFGAVFKELVAELWRQRPFPIPSDEDLGPDLVREFQPRVEQFNGMPPGAIYVTLNAWTRLYGLICMEVFDQLHWAMQNARPFFERQLMQIALELGLDPCELDLDIGDPRALPGPEVRGQAD